MWQSERIAAESAGESLDRVLILLLQARDVALDTALLGVADAVVSAIRAIAMQMPANVGQSVHVAGLRAEAERPLSV